MSLSVPLSQLIVLGRWLDSVGTPSGALLAEGGLPPDLLRGDPLSRVALPVQRLFFRLAAEKTGDPACLLQAALEAPAGACCLAELPLLAAGDLDEAELCLKRAWQQPSMGLTAAVQRAGEALAVTLHDSEGSPDRYRFLIGTWIRLARALGTPLRRLEMPLQPDEPLAPYQAHCAEVSSGGAVLRLELAGAEGAFPGRNPLLFAWLLEMAERQGGPVDLEAQVRQEIQLALHRAEPISIRSVARATALSTRTLQRRLLEEGVRFRSLVATERCVFAARLLRDGRVSVKQVATRVGFQGTSSFDRAFQLWSGQTPGQFRGREGEEP